MSYEFYHTVHLFFLCLLCLSLGGLWLFYNSKGSQNKSLKRNLMFLHGLSVFFLFVAGFGLIAKLKLPTPWPHWIYVKLIIWLCLASFPVFLKLIESYIRSSRIKSILSLGTFCLLIAATLITLKLKY